MRRATLFFLLLSIAGTAGAQMMVGGTHPGTVMTGMVGMGDHRDLIVGTDGTVYTIRIANLATAPAPVFEVVAVRSSGAIGWTASVDAGMTFIALSGTNLLVTTSPQQTPAATSSKLVALSTASGSVQWTLPLDGFAFDIEPFAGGTYVVVVKPAQSSSNTGGMRGGTISYAIRTLVAVGNDGKVLWSTPLNQ